MARQEVDVLQGTLDMLVLKALTWGRMHGYSILAWCDAVVLWQTRPRRKRAATDSSR